MLALFRGAAVVFIGASVVATAGWSSAQAPRPNRPMPQQRPMAMPVTISGTVQQMRTGLMQVSTEKQESYLVKIDPRHSKVQCTGTAEPDFLRVGLYVRFSGEFDNRGTAKGDLSELTIVTLSDAVRPGVMADNPVGGLDDQPKKKKPKVEGGKYVVVGLIRGIKNNQLNVSAPSAPGGGLKVTLAPEAKISVEVNDASLAQQGDEVEVQGSLYQPGQNGQPAGVVASDVTIKLAKPLTAPKRKGPLRAAAGHRGKRGGDAGEKGAKDDSGAAGEKGATGDKPADGLKGLQGSKEIGPAFGEKP